MMEAKRVVGGAEKMGKSPWLEKTEDGLVLTDGEITLLPDLEKSLDRLKPGNLNKELIVRAAKKGMPKADDRKGMPNEDDGNNIPNADEKKVSQLPLAIDATAGLGEDSLLLAAAGFRVKMFEHNPVIAALLKDALGRAKKGDRISEIARRMELVEGDSIEYMRALAKLRDEEIIGGVARGGEGAAAEFEVPDIILLDPMFPERKKSGLIKKKFQLLQLLESPGTNEEEMLDAAIKVSPRKILIKRPKKAEHLAGVKPSYSLEGSVIRIDCIVSGVVSSKRSFSSVCYVY